MKTNFTAAELQQLRKLVVPVNVEQFEKITAPGNTFTKDMLKTGDKVKTRGGDICLVVENCNTRKYGEQNFVLFGLGDCAGFMTADSYSQSLECIEDDWSGADIIEIYRDGEGYISAQTLRNEIDLNKYKLIWERRD